MSNSLQLHGLWPARLLCPWNSPAKNTGVDSHSLLQVIFPNQGSNPGLLYSDSRFFTLWATREWAYFLFLTAPSLKVFITSLAKAEKNSDVSVKYSSKSFFYAKNQCICQDKPQMLCFFGKLPGVLAERPGLQRELFLSVLVLVLLL